MLSLSLSPSARPSFRAGLRFETGGGRKEERGRRANPKNREGGGGDDTRLCLLLLHTSASRRRRRRRRRRRLFWLPIFLIFLSRGNIGKGEGGEKNNWGKWGLKRPEEERC